MKKTWAFIAVSAVVFAICCYHYSALKRDSLLHKQDLDGCELYIHNSTCSTLFEIRTVDDDDLLNQIVELCLRTEPFRPSTLSDMKAGASGPLCRLENETCAYTFSCIDAVDQLDIGYIHRDKPIICTSKAAIVDHDRYKAYESEWGWFCTMSPADFALLYDLLETYTGGEII